MSRVYLTPRQRDNSVTLPGFFDVCSGFAVIRRRATMASMNVPDETLRVGGMVLCGGKSSRMGQPKHLLPFGDETMLQRVVRLLGEVVSPIVVVAGPNQSLPTLPEGVLVARDEREYLGPLAGLSAGLTAIGSTVGAVYVSGCDVPLLKTALVRRMVHCLGNYDLVIPREKQFYHPLAAVYRTRLQEQVRALIAQDQLRAVSLVDACHANVIDVDDLRSVDLQLDSFRNVNTPEDYRSVLREAGAETEAHSPRN